MSTTAPAHPLADQRLLIIPGTSGIAREIAAQAAAAGTEVVLAGRAPGMFAAAAAALGATTAHVDLSDENSIRALADQLGEVDHVVAAAAAPANGPVHELRREAVVGAFEAKVIGPLLLAKHLAPRIRSGGSLLLFSGVVAWRPLPGLAVMAATNGAVATLAEALAIELAPVRVNAISPGITDSRRPDGRISHDREAFLRVTAAALPVRRVGRPEDVAAAAVLALTNPFLTGATLHVDGGGRLA